MRSLGLRVLLFLGIIFTLEAEEDSLVGDATLAAPVADIAPVAGAVPAAAFTASGVAAPNGRPLRLTPFPLPDRFARPAAVPWERAVIPVGYPSGGSVENPKTGPIPGIEQGLTQHYITQYSSAGGVAWLKSVMERASPYLGFIREEVKRRGLPEELIYLPVIESGYIPTALSRSGAAGLWQFMRNSIGPFDMKVDDWIDERMDFWKSTQGALQKLEENYHTLGNWPLALAAYNAGLGGINQVVRRSGTKDYWKLSEQKALRTETLHYVPKLLAVAHVLSRPRKYGLDLWQESPEWKRVPVDKTVDLDILAREAGIDRETLHRGNRELLYNISPPASGYTLKVPAEYVEAVTEVLRRGGLELIQHYYHTVRYGDTLSALALHYGVTVPLIEKANPGVKSTALKIGSRLKIPAIKEVRPYVSQYHAPLESFTGTYRVKKGDTLWSIALAHDTDPETLAQANNMEMNGILREGRTLKVPIK